MITIEKKLISPERLKQMLPLSSHALDVRGRKLQEIKDVLARRDDKLILIVGPCSADNEQAFYQYLSQISILNDEVGDKILIIPRLYTAKPRSRGDSYKGIMYSQNPFDKSVDFECGLITARRMFVTALDKFGFVCADELLHTDTYDYFDDIVSYAVIGARNAESQQHRFLASGMDIPVAFKNPVGGNLTALSNAIATALRPNTFIYNQNQANSLGNPFAHAVLRGGVDRNGRFFSNHDVSDILELGELMLQAGATTPAIIIDASHCNSKKNHLEQSRIVLDSYKQIQKNAKAKAFFAGFMIESYIYDGACKEGDYIIGKSVTDPCLGLEKTIQLAKELYNLIEK